MSSLPLYLVTSCMVSMTMAQHLGNRRDVGDYDYVMDEVYYGPSQGGQNGFMGEEKNLFKYIHSQLLGGGGARRPAQLSRNQRLSVAGTGIHLPGEQLLYLKRDHHQNRGYQEDTDQYSDQHRDTVIYLEGPGYTTDFVEDQNDNQEFFDESFPAKDQFIGHSHFNNLQTNYGKRHTPPYIQRPNNNDPKLNKEFVDENFPELINHNDGTFADLPEHYNHNSFQQDFEFHPNIDNQNEHLINHPHEANFGNLISGNEIRLKRNQSKLHGSQQNYPNIHTSTTQPEYQPELNNPNHQHTDTDPGHQHVLFSHNKGHQNHNNNGYLHSGGNSKNVSGERNPNWNIRDLYKAATYL